MTAFTTQKHRMQALLLIHRMYPNASPDELRELGVTAEDEALLAETTRAFAAAWTAAVAPLRASLSTFAEGCRKATAILNAAALNAGGPNGR